MFVADEGVAAVREDLVVWLVGRFANRPYVRLAGSLDRNGCVGGLVGVPRSAPGPHPNPLPSNGRGGCLRRMSVLLR